jgi:hypothetical protein
MQMYSVQKFRSSTTPGVSVSIALRKTKSNANYLQHHTAELCESAMLTNHTLGACARARRLAPTDGSDDFFEYNSRALALTYPSPTLGFYRERLLK